MNKKDSWNYLRYLNFAFSFGVTMLISIFSGYYVGNWLDKKLATGPYLMLVGVLLGVAVSFYALLQELLVLEKLKLPAKKRIKDKADKDSK